MSSLRPKLLVILPLLIGVGMLWAITQWKPLAKIEHALFIFPERFEPKATFPDRGNLSDFKVTPLSFRREEEPRSLRSYIIDDKTRDIIDDLTPEKWAYLLDTIRSHNDGLLIITAPLSWTDASELSLQTLDYQIAQAPNLVIGLDAEFNNTKAPLPPFLESSIITSSIPDFLHLPQIDFLTLPPSIKAPLFGISTVQGLPIETTSDDFKIPMLIRWGDFVLPSTHLASLIAAHQLQPQDVIIDPSGYLRLGEEGSILKIDSQGWTTFQNSQNALLSAAQILTHPEETSSSKILLAPNSPKSLTLLEPHLTSALSQKPTPLKTYQRWTLPVEVSALIILTLLLQTRRLWLVILGIAAIFIASIHHIHWCPTSPIALLLATFAILPKTSRKKTVAPESEAHEKIEPPKPKPAKPEPAKPEPVKPEPAKPEPAKPEPAKPKSEESPPASKKAAPAKKAASKKTATKATKKATRKQPSHKKKKRR